MMGEAAQHDARRADGEAAHARHRGAAGAGRQYYVERHRAPVAETLAMSRLHRDGIGSLRAGPRPPHYLIWRPAAALPGLPRSAAWARR